MSEDTPDGWDDEPVTPWRLARVETGLLRQIEALAAQIDRLRAQIERGAASCR